MTTKFWGSHDPDESSAWDNVYLTPNNGNRFKLPGIAHISINQEIELDKRTGTGNTNNPVDQLGRKPITVSLSLEIRERRHHVELEKFLLHLTKDWLPQPTTFKIEHPYAEMWKLDRVRIESFNTPAPTRDEGIVCGLTLVEYREKPKTQNPEQPTPRIAGPRSRIKVKGDEFVPPQAEAQP